LNENLNAIIGGKSSGKSLLLYSTAKSIDPEQVNKASKRLGFEGYNLNTSFDFEVTWKSGEKDALNDVDLSKKIHKITYIPQLYINYLVEKNNKEELNNLIKSILLQDTTFRAYYEEKVQAIKDETLEIENLLNNYLQVRTKALEVSQKSRELGKSEAILKGITAIEISIAAGQKASNLDNEEFKKYKDFIDSKSSKEATLKEWQGKRQVLSKVLNEVIGSRNNLLGSSSAVGSKAVGVKGQVDRIIDELTSIPPDVMEIRKQLETDFEKLVENLRTRINALKIEDNKAVIENEIASINNALIPYLQKLAGQNELKKLTLQLETEKEKYQTALNLEKQLATVLNDYTDIRKQTVIKLKKRHELYKELSLHINGTKSNIAPEISLTSTLLYRRENFALYEQTNKAAISTGHYFESLFSEGVVNYDIVPDLYSKPLKVVEDKLIMSSTDSIPLKQKTSLENVLRGLIADAFELDYTVTYKGDDLLNMSPGKKGTVLLILFLQISSSEYPILIDQPEDNLDNRTIYDLLCTMIKKKKHERQIIIVSHNANLVVATDTENIIVANQEGQGAAMPAGSTRFQYVNGSLEHSFPLDTT
jgi:ABC-type dipeptide/oligopeptide/nickel transport system ATPase component